MQQSGLIIVIGLGLLASNASASSSTNPIQKVLELLSGLEGKVVKEGEAAQKNFDDFSEFCEERSANLGFDIKTGKSEVESLKASIEKASADAASSTAKIEELSAQLATSEADLKAATEVRAKETADFAAEDADLSETIDTISRAIRILEKEMSGGASLMQLHNAASVEQALAAMVQASAFSSADASRLTALVQSSTQESDGDMDVGAPDPAAYKSQSGGIVSTLEDLLQKARDQQDELRKKETAGRHNFELVQQSLQTAIKYGDKDMAAAKKALAAAETAQATAEGDLATTSATLAEDIKTLADTHKDCLDKATQFEEETKSRGEELKALATAKKVITSMTEGAESQTYGLNQVALMQVDRSLASANGFQAVRFLRALAQKQHSAALTQLVSRVASTVRHGASNGDDVFGKVKGLIREMLERLHAEAEADASHKAFCDKEMAETAAKKADKQAEIAKISTKLEKMSSRSAQLKDEVAALQGDLAALAKAQADMDKLRADEAAAYGVNKPEMEAGIEGLKQALKILRDYYAKEGKAHEAAEGAGSSIIGLLEVAEADFTTGLADMVATEEAAAAAYERETKENDIERATKEADVKYKTKEAKALDLAVAESTSDRAAVQEELDAILEYAEQLTKQCVAKPETYEERSKRRAAEIAGLKEALKILAGEAVGLLQKDAAAGLRGAVVRRM